MRPKIRQREIAHLTVGDHYGLRPARFDQRTQEQGACARRQEVRHHEDIGRELRKLGQPDLVALKCRGNRDIPAAGDQLLDEADIELVGPAHGEPGHHQQQPSLGRLKRIVDRNLPGHILEGDAGPFVHRREGLGREVRVPLAQSLVELALALRSVPVLPDICVIRAAAVPIQVLRDRGPPLALGGKPNPQVPVLHATQNRPVIPASLKERIAADHRGDRRQILVEEVRSVVEASGPEMRIVRESDRPALHKGGVRVRGQKPGAHLQRRGLDQVISIQLENVRRTCLADAGVAALSRTGVRRQIDDADAWIALPIFIQHRQRLRVGGAIVDDDPLEVLERLRQNALSRLTEDFGRVIEGGDDRNSRNRARTRWCIAELCPRGRDRRGRKIWLTGVDHPRLLFLTPGKVHGPGHFRPKWYTSPRRGVNSPVGVAVEEAGKETSGHPSLQTGLHSLGLGLQRLDLGL